MYNTKIQVNVSKKEKFFMIKCTIAIPVYNREKFIGRAIDSALAQNVSDLEVLVVDNCSTDHTWEVLHTYRDSRLRLVRNETNLGLFGNFNCCLSLAKGKYLRFLCSDDTLVAGTLKREIAVMDAHPHVALLSTRGQRMDEEGNFLGFQADHFKQGVYSGNKSIYAILWYQAYYAYNSLNYPSGILIRRDFSEQVGQFDVNMKMLGDVDFFLRVLEHGDLAVLNTLGCNITIHVNQQSSYLLGDKSPMLELNFLIERYKLLLQQEGGYERIKQQMMAHVLGLAFKYWRIGLKDAYHFHCEIVRRSGIQKIKVFMAILRLISLRLLLKTTGIRFLPVHSVSCLKSSP